MGFHVQALSTSVTNNNTSGASASPVSRSSTVSSRARSQQSASSLTGLFRSGLDFATRSKLSSTAVRSTAGASRSQRRWTTDVDGGSPVKKSSAQASNTLGRMRHTADQPSTK